LPVTSLIYAGPSLVIVRLEQTLETVEDESPEGAPKFG